MILPISPCRLLRCLPALSLRRLLCCLLQALLPHQLQALRQLRSPCTAQTQGFSTPPLVPSHLRMKLKMKLMLLKLWMVLPTKLLRSKRRPLMPLTDHISMPRCLLCHSTPPPLHMSPATQLPPKVCKMLPRTLLRSRTRLLPTLEEPSSMPRLLLRRKIHVHLQGSPLFSCLSNYGRCCSRLWYAARADCCRHCRSTARCRHRQSVPRHRPLFE